MGKLSRTLAPCSMVQLRRVNTEGRRQIFAVAAGLTRDTDCRLQHEGGGLAIMWEINTCTLRSVECVEQEVCKHNKQTFENSQILRFDFLLT